MAKQTHFHSRRFLTALMAVLLLVLAQLALPPTNKGMISPSVFPLVDSCIAQAFVKIDKVLYQGKDNGEDVVRVLWSNHANNFCIRFGSGFDVAGKPDIPPFGAEVTVKIKRRFGNEDVKSFKGSLITAPNDTPGVNLSFPRGTLETDPVSYEAKVRTTAGIVMSKTVRLTGTGAPSLATATQTFTTHSTVPNLFGTCGPTLQLSTLDFFPGAGPKPDRVTLTWTAGLPPAPSCFDQPKVSIVVRLTRPNGAIDTGQVGVDAGNSTATISVPGTPGAVSSFAILVTAKMGSVIEKVTTSSGTF